ncbi:Hypothetical protein R9X50_00513400 [Acrodontium crateriforme]|uniref:Agmatine deiminase n=1 Tax=Acrodontium crateriforme TaxID=150365 RepID=A0AAQ3RD39_9PEZI|nr:Hypothetical protein R9X50_00513400 [Acrodontium crateriforme]
MKATSVFKYLLNGQCRPIFTTGTMFRQSHPPSASLTDPMNSIINRLSNKMHITTPLARGLATFKMPAESTLHARTLMAWPSSYSTDDNQDVLHGSRQEVAAIANAIAQFEPVTLLAPKNHVCKAEQLIDSNVTVAALQVDNLWMRDTGPIYVESSEGKMAGVNFNFNDWGNKFYPDRSVDWTTAHRVLRKDDTYEIKTNVTTEGGALEIDGEGTLMATESSIINDNRNPGLSKQQIEQTLSQTLGIEKFLWIKGVKGEDITDGHIDAVARFVRPGVVLLSRPAPDTEQVWLDAYDQARNVLENSTDARGRKLTIHDIDEPANVDFPKINNYDDPPALNYVNYLLVNGGLIMPKFGDVEADENARTIMQSLFPEREVVQVFLHWLPLSGGGIHCATQQVPALAV